MDIKSYLNRVKVQGVSLNDFAVKAKMSADYLRHILNGRRKPGVEKIITLLEASDAEISLKAIRPDIFPNNRKGKRRIELLKKSLQ